MGLQGKPSKGDHVFFSRPTDMKRVRMKVKKGLALRGSVAHKVPREDREAHAPIRRIFEENFETFKLPVRY